MKIALRAAALVCAFVFPLASTSPSFAQKYPEKSIRFIVQYPPGGATDLTARIIGQKLQEALGQSVVIDNKGGAGGNIGTAMGASAPPDGYTMLMVTPPQAINMSLYNKLPYDIVRDFAPVTLVTTGPYILVVNPDVPAKSVKELISLAKSMPGKLNYASVGIGSGPHLVAELFKATADVDMVHVPYNGAAPALNNLLSGQVQLRFDVIAASLPFVQSGKLRALGVTGTKRSTAAPDLPTIAEGGLAGFDVETWQGVMVPAGTPRDIVARLNSEIARIMSAPDVRERMLGLGLEPSVSTPEQFDAFIKAEVAKWAKVVKSSGARAE